MNSEIAARAGHTTRAEAHKMEQVAGEFRGKAINEFVEREHEVDCGRHYE